MSTTYPRRTLDRDILPISEEVASGLMRRLLVNPFSEQVGPNLSDLSDAEKDALNQITAMLGASANELIYSALVRQKALEILTRSMQANVLTEQRSRNAKESLGNAGLLTPALYTIEFNDLIKAFESLGERRNNITQVVHSPDVTQHLAPPGGWDSDANESQSIFVREIKPTKKKKFLQMVIATRSGSKLTFCAAWRFYSELISWDGTMSPLDLLKKFVEKYGMEFSIGDSSPTKFVLNETITFPPGTLPEKEIHLPERHLSHSYIAQISMKSDPIRNNLFLSLGYVIDTHSYKKDTMQVG